MCKMEKRHVMVKLVAVMFAVFAITATVAAQTPSTGWYTSNPEADTFYIRTADELAGLAKIVNDSTDDGFYRFYRRTVVLMDNIDLSAYGRSYNGGKGWIPIGGSRREDGGYAPPFDGNFDGNGKIVSGLYINDPERGNAGLFGEITGYNYYETHRYCTFRNLGVVDVDITGGDYVGGVIGRMVGYYIRVDGCYSTGTVSGGNNVGGVAGSGTVSGSYSSSTVGGANNVGGVVGNGSAYNSYSIGAVRGFVNVGGVVGAYSYIIDCAALNSNVRGETAIGRFGGGGEVRGIERSVAFINMSGVFTATNGNGTNISSAEIHADGTINGLFADATIWTVENGKLPGLFGNTVEIPEYLKYKPFTWYTDKSSPYVITYAIELAEFAALVNDGTDNFDGKTVVLDTNINLSFYGANWNDGKGWIPIGNRATENAQFLGTFDGGGHTISRLFINDNTLKSAGLFGYVSGGAVKNLGVTGINIRGGNNAGALAGVIAADGNISNCYARNGMVEGEEYIGGAVGQILNSEVTNSYSAVRVRGRNHFGGVAGSITGGGIARCYSLGPVYGYDGYNNIGGVAGSVRADGDRPGSVSNCAALVFRVSGIMPAESAFHAGRVAGYFDESAEFSGNIAFAGIPDSLELTDSDTAYTLVTVQEIRADGTLKGIFSDTSIWTTANGRLPGLFGKTVEMPIHLGGRWDVSVSVASNDRVIPQSKPDEAAVVAPVSQLTGGFTVGPNPVGRSSGAVVSFFWQGKRIKSSALVIYGASGSLVKRINLNDKNAVADNEKRNVGSWNLTDARSRPVSEGTYLVKGIITTADGKRERVSALVGVR